MEFLRALYGFIFVGPRRVKLFCGLELGIWKRDVRACVSRIAE